MNDVPIPTDAMSICDALSESDKEALRRVDDIRERMGVAGASVHRPLTGWLMKTDLWQARSGTRKFFGPCACTCP
jgi:hypothetical protein